MNEKQEKDGRKLTNVAWICQTKKKNRDGKKKVDWGYTRNNWDGGGKKIFFSIIIHTTTKELFYTNTAEMIGKVMLISMTSFAFDSRSRTNVE